MDHSAVSNQKPLAPSGKNETTGKFGINHPIISNKTDSENPFAANKTTTNNTVAAPKIDLMPKATAPSQAAKNGSSPMNVTTSGTTVLPHHKKSRTPSVSPHSIATHPRVSVPINPMSESENILEDVAHPAPRPLRAAEKFNPTFGAIVAAICITTAVGGYVILMAWRKIEM